MKQLKLQWVLKLYWNNSKDVSTIMREMSSKSKTGSQRVLGVKIWWNLFFLNKLWISILSMMLLQKVIFGRNFAIDSDQAFFLSSFVLDDLPRNNFSCKTEMLRFKKSLRWLVLQSAEKKRKVEKVVSIARRWSLLWSERKFFGGCYR